MRFCAITIFALAVTGCSGSYNTPMRSADDAFVTVLQSSSSASGSTTSTTEEATTLAGSNVSITEEHTASAGSTTSSTEEPTAPEPSINADNYAALLTQAFEVFSGRAYDERLNSSNYVTSYDPPHCESGIANAVNPNTKQYYFTDCVINGEKINGFLDRNFDIETAQLLFADSFNSDLGGLGEMHVSGVYNRICCSYAINFHTYNFGYQFTYSGGYLTITDATVETTGDKTSRVIHGSFSMQGSSTNDAVIDVATGDWLEIQGIDNATTDWAFDAGTLVMKADDYSTLTLQANNGESSTVNITIVNANGTQTLSVPWGQFKDVMTWGAKIEVQALQYNVGDMLNKLAGDDLAVLSDEVTSDINHAISTASANNLPEPIQTTDDTTNPPTTTIITESTYQCSGGGTIARTQTKVDYLEGGFYFLGEHSDIDAYAMNNCIFVDAEYSDHRLTLDGQFDIVKTSRSGRKHSTSSIRYIWQSFQQRSYDFTDKSSEYYVDGTLLTSSYNNDTQRGSSRYVTLADYEHTSEIGAKELIEDASYNQSESFGNYSGARTIDFEVSGQYTGPLSDNHKVSISTQSNFELAQNEFSNAVTTEEKAAKGEFTLASSNGDAVNISVTGELRESYYAAIYRTTDTDGATLLSAQLPFYKYLADGEGFATRLWVIPPEWIQPYR